MPGARVNSVKLRGGFEGVGDMHATPVEPVDLLVRATAALRQVRANEGGGQFQRYDPEAAGSN